MQKNVIIAVVAVAVLGGGAFFFLQSQKSATQQNNVVTSIKDALSKSASLECTYTDEEGRQSKTFMKNGAVRSDFTGKTTEDTGSAIITAKKMYMWNANKEGFMMDIPEVTPSAESTTETDTNSQNAQKDEIMKDLEQYKESCKAAVVSDSLFTPPSDVKFTDYSQMMQQNPGAGSGISEEQMQQYQQYMENSNPAE